MSNNHQPTPDELLKFANQAESRKRNGSLKIFFGMSAGVGKTYAMLTEAKQKLKEGLNVAIGIVNSHGRKETEELLIGLPILPEKWVNYREIAFKEFDLESALEKKPDLLIVDELAHTNVPGSKHAKRWQDVLELLDAGIDVYATLNVQHIESRKDLVEMISGIQVRETVPDLILEKAITVELIDITPQKLLQRLKEGKVYVGDLSRIAMENFFKEETLTALREIALRFTAEKVEHDFHGILAGRQGWSTREKILVAISPSPQSDQLIRMTRRRAFALDAPWCAVYIDTGRGISEEDQKRLAKHLHLAQDLGGETITTLDTDIVEGLTRVAHQTNSTQVVIGRGKKRGLKHLFSKSLVEKLEERTKEMDLVILRVAREVNHQKAPPLAKEQRFSLIKDYLIAIGALVFFTFLGYLIHPIVGYRAFGFIILVGIFLLSFFVGKGAIIFAAICFAFIWDIIFIPPEFRLKSLNFEDSVFLFMYFIVAVVMGALISRLRKQDRIIVLREAKIRSLYEIEKVIAKSRNYESLRKDVLPHLEKNLAGSVDLLITNAEMQALSHCKISLLSNEKEESVALWVLHHGKPAGRFTDTLPSAIAMYSPLKSHGETFGVLVYSPKKDIPLLPTGLDFIQNVCQLVGPCFERFVVEEKSRVYSYAKEIEKLHNAFFHSLSKGFYQPLNKMFQIKQQLEKKWNVPEAIALLNELEQTGISLKFIVDNILSLSELESGFLRLDKKQHNINTLVDAAITAMNNFVNRHTIRYLQPESPIFAIFDLNLIGLALKNVIRNAIEHSPPGTTVIIEAEVLDGELMVSVTDEGPGIEEEIVPLIFEKFYRAEDSKSKGIGLGLTVVEAVIHLHQGRILVNNIEKGGTKLSLILPI